MKFLSILLAMMVLGNSIEAHDLEAIYEAPLIKLDKIERKIDKIVLKDESPLNELDQNLVSYTELLSTFNELKLYDINFINSLLSKIKNQETLLGEELTILRRTIDIYYKVNQKILDFAKTYDFGAFSMPKNFASNNKNMLLLKAHLIWLSGHLLVLDHLVEIHTLLYENDGEFRRIVKNALLDKHSSSEGTNKTINELINMSQYTVETGESLKFAQEIHLVRATEGELKEILVNEIPSLALVESVIVNKTATQIAQGRKDFQIKNYSFVDFFYNAFDNITNTLSRFFGNLAGSIRWRKGYLYKNKKAYNMTVQNLAPMDILIEKSPFVLTDKFIPGHFGHIAVYLGTKEQLESIGMWDHPNIIPYQDDIIEGKVILEAVRTGVRLTTVEEFLNIDEVTVMTKVDGLKNPNLLFEEITRGMDQIGKAYDFNFDVSTLDTIVCSELIYITFGNVHWPTKYRLGRATITPDDEAEVLFQKDTKFKVKNIIVSKSRRKIEHVDLSYLAGIFDYELRSNEGSPIENPEDPTNSYWKKQIKCYNVVVDMTEEEQAMGRYETKRTCNVSYKEYHYEERTEE